MNPSGKETATINKSEREINGEKSGKSGAIDTHKYSGHEIHSTFDSN